MLNLNKIQMLSYSTYFYLISAELFSQMIKTLYDDKKSKLGYNLFVTEPITY